MEGVFLSVHLLFSRKSCTYDTLGRVTRSESGSAWVQYAYAEDRLSTITHSGGTNTAYSFAYTTGGLTGSVTVGSRQLVTNSYNPGTWTLSGQSYGNGQSWSYTYNNAGQITSRSDGTNTWRYYYNSEGALGRVERYSGQTKTGALRNYYDSADRLIRVVEQDGSGAVVHEYAWTYDSNDKVTSLTETVNGESFSSTYSGKEYRRINGIRPDYIDFNTRTIYELKPMNPRGVRSGIRQLQKYNNALGGGFNLRLELY